MKFLEDAISEFSEEAASVFPESREILFRALLIALTVMSFSQTEEAENNDSFTKKRCIFNCVFPSLTKPRGIPQKETFTFTEVQLSYELAFLEYIV